MFPTSAASLTKIFPMSIAAGTFFTNLSFSPTRLANLTVHVAGIAARPARHIHRPAAQTGHAAFILFSAAAVTAFLAGTTAPGTSISRVTPVHDMPDIRSFFHPPHDYSYQDSTEQAGNTTSMASARRYYLPGISLFSIHRFPETLILLAQRPHGNAAQVIAPYQACLRTDAVGILIPNDMRMAIFAVIQIG